jgi:hypothetical protein
MRSCAPSSSRHTTAACGAASYVDLVTPTQAADASQPGRPGNLILVHAVGSPEADDPAGLLLMPTDPTDNEWAGHVRLMASFGAHCPTLSERPGQSQTTLTPLRARDCGLVVSA